jgi:hypothetical protein
LYQEEAEEAKRDVEMEIYYLQMDLFKKESEMKMLAWCTNVQV